MKKKYISPDVEIQRFTIYCDEMISQTPETEEPGIEEGGNEFPF